jgi:hypothetical protein
MCIGFARGVLMATMTVNTPDRNEQPLMTRLLRGFRARIDAFVSSRLRNAVPKATRVEGSRWKQGESFVAQTDQAETPTLELQPLGEDILNAAIPAFFIGRNRAGLWIAREARGRIGGKFLFKWSALAFARAQSEPAQCAMVFPSERFELDLENEGNPLAQHAELLLHCGARLRRQIARSVRTAVLALSGLAGIVTLQAAVYVYVWRLLG